MLMEQVGTQVQEKEFTFTTPQVRGLSYKLLNPKSTEFKKHLAQCYEFIDQAAKNSHTVYNLPTDLMVKRCIEQHCDTWVSMQGNKIVGCCTIGVMTYGPTVGIILESISGTWVREDVMPIVEKFYKDLGFKFVEVVGRKGWERTLNKMGYKFSKITLHKEL